MAAGAMLVAAASALWLWRAGGRRAEGWLAEADSASVPSIAVERGTARRLDAPADSEVMIVTAPDEARDAASLGDGSLVVATAGGALLYRGAAPGGGAPRRLTHLDGMSGVDLVSAAAFAGGVLVGDAAGGLTLVDAERLLPLRLALAHTAPVVEMAVAGDTAFLLITGVGVLAFDGREARDVGAAAHVDLRSATALCLGAGGLTVGGREGELWMERARPGGRVELARSTATVPGPITSLACGDSTSSALHVGTPSGVFLVEQERASPLAPDLHATSLLRAPEGLLVATFDDGVWLLEGTSGHRRAHFLPGRRVQRLRATSDRVVALTQSGAEVLSSGAFAALASPPRGLGSPTVTALAEGGGGRVVVGEFAGGLEVLDRELLVDAPPALPRDADARDRQINALHPRAGSRGLLAATVRGVLSIGAAGTSRLSLGDVPGVDGVAAIAELPRSPTSLALATARGLVLTDGVNTRLLYGFHGLANNHVYALATHEGRLVAGTLGGLSIVELDGDHPRVVRSLGAGPGALRSAWVTALADTPEGVYVGTYGGGLQLLRLGAGGQAVVEAVVSDVAAPFLAHVNPGALTVDGDTIWVGTLEAGLLAFDRTAHTLRRAEHLLPAADAGPVLVVGDTLYIGCASGVVRATRHAVQARLAPLRSTHSPGGSS